LTRTRLRAAAGRLRAAGSRARSPKIQARPVRERARWHCGADGEEEMLSAQAVLNVNPVTARPGGGRQPAGNPGSLPEGRRP
jgi:hypothetical protein